MFTKIRDNLYLSSKDSITHSRVESCKIKAIINVANEIKSPDFRKVASYHCGFADNAVEAERNTEAVAAFAAGLICEGKNVLIHCKQGASRSPHVVATVLAALEGMSYEEAYAEVKSLHPRAMDFSLGEEIKSTGLWKK